MKRTLILGMILVMMMVGFVAGSMIKNTWPTRQDVAGYEINLNINKGWNLIPTISFINEDSAFVSTSEITREDIEAMWFFSTNQERNYQLYPKLAFKGLEKDAISLQIDVDDYINTGAVWIYSNKEGVLRYNMFVNDYDLMDNRKLLKGWNFFTITPKMSGREIQEFKGDCNLERIYLWDSQDQKWEFNPNDWNEEDVILVKTDTNCNLGASSLASPPQIPRVPSQDQRMYNHDGSLDITDAPDFPETIGDYTLYRYNKKNWNSNCYTVGFKEICVMYIGLEYLNKETRDTLSLQPMIVYRGDKGVYEDSVIIDNIDEELEENIYHLEGSGSSQKIWSVTDGYDLDFIKAPTCLYITNEDGSSCSVCGCSGFKAYENPVTSYFIDKYLPKKLIE